MVTVKAFLNSLEQQNLVLPNPTMLKICTFASHAPPGCVLSCRVGSDSGGGEGSGAVEGHVEKVGLGVQTVSLQVGQDRFLDEMPL